MPFFQRTDKHAPASLSMRRRALALTTFALMTLAPAAQAAIAQRGQKQSQRTTSRRRSTVSQTQAGSLLLFRRSLAGTKGQRQRIKADLAKAAKERGHILGDVEMHFQPVMHPNS